MANEKRLIDANGSYTLNADDNTGYSICFYGGTISVFDDFGRCVCELDAEDAPTVDAVEVVHGRWIGKGGLYQGECSVCGYMTFDKTAEWARSYWHYCPNCGAKMDGDGNEDV